MFVVHQASLCVVSYGASTRVRLCCPQRRRGRSPPNRPGQRPHAIVMQCVLAGDLRWHFGGRPKPFDQRARRFRAGAMAAVLCSSSARAHRPAKPLRIAAETMKTVLSRYSRHRHALRYGHFIHLASDKALDPVDPPPLEIDSNGQRTHHKALWEPAGGV